MSEETLRKLAQQVRNWGRWGAEDEIGTLNYITREAIAGACRLVTSGKVFALGIPLQRQGPQSGTRQRFNPIHTMFRDGGDQPRSPSEVTEMQGYGGSDDWIVMPLQCVTQWDSLAHVFYEGKMYNGRDATLVTSSGAAKNSIDKTKDKIVGRGVLLDVPRHKGVRALAPGYAITIDDLEAAAQVRPSASGAGRYPVCMRRRPRRWRRDRRHLARGYLPALRDAPWMHAASVAACQSRYEVEVRPSSGRRRSEALSPALRHLHHRRRQG